MTSENDLFLKIAVSRTSFTTRLSKSLFKLFILSSILLEIVLIFKLISENDLKSLSVILLNISLTLSVPDFRIFLYFQHINFLKSIHLAKYKTLHNNAVEN